jgi:hypothetical protein
MYDIPEVWSASPFRLDVVRNYDINRLDRHIGTTGENGHRPLRHAHTLFISVYTKA